MKSRRPCCSHSLTVYAVCRHQVGCTANPSVPLGAHSQAFFQAFAWGTMSAQIKRRLRRYVVKWVYRAVVMLSADTCMRTKPGMVLNKLQLLESDEGKKSLIAKQMRREEKRTQRGSRSPSRTSTNRQRRGSNVSTSSGFQAAIDRANAMEASNGSHTTVSFGVVEGGDEVCGLAVDTSANQGSWVLADSLAPIDEDPLSPSTMATPGTSCDTQRHGGEGQSTRRHGRVTSKKKRKKPRKKAKQEVYKPSAGSIAAQVHSHRLLHHFRSSRRAVQVRCTIPPGLCATCLVF